MLNLKDTKRPMKNLIVASTSTMHGGDYLQYLLPILEGHFSHAKEIIFIPFARPGGITHDAYTEKVRSVFKALDKNVKGLHEFEHPEEALADAQGLFTGGGNTFVLVKQLHERGLMEPLRQALHEGIPYLGTSAGSNICGVTMQTTNDMPIVYPPSFKTLGMLPFNLNPHYLDPDPSSTHMGETRETRINEFHSQNQLAVVGLREGSWIQVKGDAMILEGELNARVFEKDKSAYEVEPGTNFSYL